MSVKLYFPVYQRKHLWYVAITAAATTLASLGAYRFMQPGYAASGILLTAALLLPLILLLAPAFRSMVWGSLFAVFLAALLQTGNAIKVSLMKAPIHAADLQTVPLLLKTLSGRYICVAVAISLMALVLLGWGLRWRRRTPISIAGAIAYLACLAWATPSLELVAKHVIAKPDQGSVARQLNVDDQTDELRRLGAPLYLIHDWILLQHDVGMIPSRAQVAALAPAPWGNWKKRPTRNVYVVLLESIWDTSVMDDFQFNRSTLDPRFLAMWEAAGKPHALSPVIGGMTANSEFEVLCGMVAPSTAVAFTSLLRESAPCLPAAFARMGYQTVAGHPHDADNWNRRNAYSRVGFQRYFPIEAFELDDMEGSYLSDSSFFRQSLAHHQTLPAGRPVFQYLVSLSSHWAYGRDPSKRPDLVSISPSEPRLLKGYANASAYTTAAFMDWVFEVLKQDPDALIVGFGDHAPVLDALPDVYAHLNARDPGAYDSAATRQLIALARTPLLVINGAEGPVKLGDDIPLYSVPQIIGQLLGEAHPLPQSRPAGGPTVRKVLGQILVKDESGWHGCPKDSPASPEICRQAERMHQQMRLVRQDLAAGRQFMLSTADSVALAKRDGPPMELVHLHASCEFEVKDWGPKASPAGRPFNAQQDGRSAVWISVSKLRGTPVVRVGDVVGKVSTGDNVITAAFDAGTLGSKAGMIPIEVSCPGDDAITIGNLEIY